MKEDTKLAKWLEGAMDEKELREFESLPEFETYRKIKEFSAQLSAPETDTDNLYNAIAAKRNANTKKVVRLHSPWLVRIAAVLVIALGLTFFFYTTNVTTQVADNGERTEFLLPDNSSVVLNAGSTAEFKSWNWNKKRSVDLNGEAYFKVAKGKTFDVNTPLGKVTVVGTQFNVKSRDGRFDVTCFEGKVKVTYNGTETFITPGQSVSFEEGKNIEIPQTAAQQPSWMGSEISFEKETPENIIRELERQYNVKIQLDATLTEPSSVTLPLNDLDAAIDNIATLYHLKATKTGKNTIILSME